MGWTRARFGSVLTVNRDGTPKEAPTLWTPPKMQILIPPGDQDHARPFVVMDGKSATEVLTLILYEDRVDGMIRGQTTRLVEL